MFFATLSSRPACPPATAASAALRPEAALDLACAIDKRTVWPTHRIRGFLLSQQRLLQPTR